MPKPAFSPTRIAAARTIGASVAAVWISQHAPGLDLCLVEGVSHLSILMADSPAADAMQAFFDGGRDHLAAIGLGLADRAGELRIALDSGMRESLDEIREHAGRGTDALVGTFRSGIAKTDEFASFLLLETGFAKDEGKALEVLESGKGILDALHGIIKAWGVFTLARKAWNWGMGRAPEAPAPVADPDAAIEPVVTDPTTIKTPDTQPGHGRTLQLVTIEHDALVESAANTPARPEAGKTQEATDPEAEHCRENQPCI